MSDKTVSALWQHIHEHHVTKDAIANLENFKSSAVNYKLAIWNPDTNGAWYFKNFLYNLCSQLSDAQLATLKRIKNREIGNPLVVTFDGEQICMDYLQAVLEMEYISKSISLENKKIVEIGAGYGRSCHALLSNYEINEYLIVDLGHCLQLSKMYLSEVLTAAQLAKVRFVSAEQFLNAPESSIDLCVNIDSFAEIDATIVQDYLSCLDASADALYVKNPVGKYSDARTAKSPIAQLALETGLLRDVVDIYDNQAIEAKRDKFVESYSPGSDWQCIADSWARPWSYYWQAVYRKQTK